MSHLLRVSQLHEGQDPVVASLEGNAYTGKGRVKKFLLNRLVEFSIKWVGGVKLNGLFH